MYIYICTNIYIYISIHIIYEYVTFRTKKASNDSLHMCPKLTSTVFPMEGEIRSTSCDKFTIKSLREGPAEQTFSCFEVKYVSYNVTVFGDREGQGELDEQTLRSMQVTSIFQGNPQCNMLQESFVLD